MEEERLLRKMRSVFSEEIDQDEREELLLKWISEGQTEGVFVPEEASMMRNVISFKHMDAKDVMTHRKHICALDASCTLEECMQEIMGRRYSRFPVYQETIDQIIGSVHIRDLLKAYMSEQNRSVELHALKDCLKPVACIPETRNIERLLKQMKARKNHMAVVIDEYGQTSGIVTMEDIIEEIVGNIQDEYDEDVEEVVKLSEGSYLVQGGADLEDLENLLRIEFEKSDYGTVNGFLIDMLDRIPAEDESSSVDYEGYRFHILSVDNNMIQTVKIVKI